MNKKPYSSAIKKTPFKYTIAKKIAKLILDGLDRNEVYEKCWLLAGNFTGREFSSYPFFVPLRNFNTF